MVQEKKKARKPCEIQLVTRETHSQFVNTEGMGKPVALDCKTC